jgi:ferritin-like metal-binding protein YciE
LAEARLTAEEFMQEKIDLMMAFAVENTELALYEALARTAEASGDSATVLVAREIKKEERAMADNVWKLLPSVATEAFLKVTTDSAHLK